MCPRRREWSTISGSTWAGSTLAYKYYTRIEETVNDKRYRINYGRIQFYFHTALLGEKNKLENVSEKVLGSGLGINKMAKKNNN